MSQPGHSSNPGFVTVGLRDSGKVFIGSVSLPEGQSHLPHGRAKTASDFSSRVAGTWGVLYKGEDAKLCPSSWSTLPLIHPDDTVPPRKPSFLSANPAPWFVAVCYLMGGWGANNKGDLGVASD